MPKKSRRKNNNLRNLDKANTAKANRAIEQKKEAALEAEGKREDPSTPQKRKIKNKRNEPKSGIWVFIEFSFVLNFCCGCVLRHGNVTFHYGDIIKVAFTSVTLPLACFFSMQLHNIKAGMVERRRRAVYKMKIVRYHLRLRHVFVARDPCHSRPSR